MPEATGGTGSAATDETDQLISSTKVEGTAVYNQQGERLGTVASFMVNSARARSPRFMEGDSPNWGDRAWAGGIDAYYADRPDRPRDEAAIDDAVDDSFPASDPPSWSGGATGAGTPSKP